MKEENYIFGIRAIIEAINAGKSFSKVIARSGINGELFGELKALCDKKKIRIQGTTPEVLDRITTGNHQGVIAFLDNIEYVKLDDILSIAEAKGETPLIVMLDGVTDVRNFGAIVRSADCAGVHAIIVPTKGSAPINGESVKTSAGALHYVPICTTNNPYLAAKTLKDKGVKVIGATEKGADDYYKVDFTQPTLVVMGSEDKGISNQLLKLCDAKAKIPMTGHIESLNVSVAAGIMLFEAVRQRSGK